MIFQATQKYDKAIYHLAQKNSLRNLNLSKRTNGFLVSDFSLGDYNALIKKVKHFYVAIHRHKVIAFMFMYSMKDLDLRNPVTKFMQTNNTRDFYVIKQICVDDSVKGKGYAKMIYQYVMNEIDEDFMTAIVKEPRNEASIAFHEHIGFKLIGEIMGNDAMMRYIYYYDHSKKYASYNIETIKQQYLVNAESYRHEDNLNWSKVSNLFYVTSVLITACGVLLSLTISYVTFIILLLSVIGIISSFIYMVAINNGVTYLSSRKESLIQLERILIHDGGEHVFLPYNRNQTTLRKSSTMNAIQLFPKILLAIWIVVCISLLVLTIF